MIGILAKLVGRVSGPVLVYALLGLLAVNAITAGLLKNAWQENARAVLQCENAALRDANEVNEKTSQILLKSQKEFAEYRAQVRKLTVVAEKETEAIRRQMELAHEQEIADLEVVTNEIPDDDFYCASEPVSSGVLSRMRDAVAAYNANRGGDGH